MSYTFDKSLNCSFETAIEKVTAALKAEGFGVINEIDMKATMKQKIDKDISPYKILGACNPHLAFRALSAEPKIGSMLPCNVVVRELAQNKIEVSIIDPVASMMAIKNPNLGEVAKDVHEKLKKVAENLN